MAVAPINKVREVLDYGVKAIPPSKTNMGIPNYGYDWALPYVKGTSKAQTIGIEEALKRAIQYNVPIQFDPLSQSPFYNYTSSDSVNHQVWFENARSIEAKLKLIPEYDLLGVGYWNLMKYFPANWLVLNALFDIRKVI